MAQHVGGEVAHVGGDDVAAAAQDGQRPGAVHEPDRPAGAGPVLDERDEVGEAVLGRPAGGVGHATA